MKRIIEIIREFFRSLKRKYLEWMDDDTDNIYPLF